MSIKGYIKTLSFCGFIGISFSTNAGVILSPNSASGPTALLGNITEIINQSGLYTNFTSGATDFNTYLSTSPMHNAVGIHLSGYFANVPLPESIDFDLGAVYNVSETAIWNFNANVDAAIDSLEIFSSSDASFTNLTSLGTFNLTTNPWGNRDIGHQLLDTLDVDTQYIRLLAQSNHGFNGNPTVGIGLSEIVFNASTVAPVPLPGAIWLFGSALVGFVGMRKLQKPATVQRLTA